MVAFGNPVEGPRVVEFGGARGPTDKLANGHPAFRVSQRFADVNLAVSTKPHGALDIANYNCGDKVLAARAGVAVRGTYDGANYIVIDHGDGWKTEYWHLASFAIASGSVRVTEGQFIGTCGTTGNSVYCHLHWAVKEKVNGVWVLRDGWPLMRQNGAVEESDVQIKGKWVAHVVNKKSAVNATIGNFRDSPISGAVLQGFPDKTVLYPVVEVEGDLVAGSKRWFGMNLYVDGKGWNFGYMHISILEPFTPYEQTAPTGHTDAEMAAAVAAATKAGTTAGIAKGQAAEEAIWRNWLPK